MSLLNDHLEDPLLKQIEDGIAQRLTPQNRTNYEKTVNAGLAVAFNKGPEGLRALVNAEDPVKASALGGANMALLLFKQTNGQMPIEVVPPAAMTLMLQAMDTLEKAKLYKPTKEDVARGAHIQVERIMAALGLTMPMFMKMKDKTEAVMNDPAKMEEINKRLGVVRDPNASSPTVVPTAAAPTEETTDGV